jgi:hypothetical protein
MGDLVPEPGPLEGRPPIAPLFGAPAGRMNPGRVPGVTVPPG